ncbi:MAG: matrixin family metalloprotease [Minisyncoccota bacterium]
MMRKMLSLFFMCVVLAVSFITWPYLVPCQRPIQYSFGSFDRRFGISEEQFHQAIGYAEKIWEDASGKNLLEYRADAPLTVNLIFDERQEQTLAGQILAQSLSDVRDAQEKIEGKDTRLLHEYQQKSREYNIALHAFNTDMIEYNQEVTQWNVRGNVPRDVYARLQQTSVTMGQSQEKLESMRLALNALAESINHFSQEQIAMVEQYNQQVNTYTQHYGTSNVFDQGEYMGKAINLYQFEDIPHLRLVAIHEFGHTIGIGHVTDPHALMYYMMGQQDVTKLSVTQSDRQALQEICRPSLINIVSHWKSQLHLLLGSGYIQEKSEHIAVQ